MKKYIKPEISEVEVVTESLLTSNSDPSLNDRKGDGVWRSKGHYDWEYDDDYYDE